MQYSHELEFKVRDYECDMQGVVNNAVYQNYLEHARHEFLQSRGINFAEVTSAGIHLVVVRAEQDIYRLPDDTLMLAARVTGTSLNESGRPFLPEALKQLFIND
jgi:acyl-CoA thioester hydrolase